MSSTKNAQDVKKEEFRKYLDKGGVIELLTKGLVALYEEPEKPGDAVQFLRSNMGAGAAEKLELEQLQKENAELKQRISDLETSNSQLMQKISAEQPAEAAAVAVAETLPTTDPEPADQPGEKSAAMETEGETTKTTETAADKVEEGATEEKKAEEESDNKMETEEAKDDKIAGEVPQEEIE